MTDQAPEPTPNRRVLGIDIGGANIKIASVAEHALSVPFAMWRDAEQLGPFLQNQIAEFPGTSPDVLAVTMTGELADCFSTRREGVEQILRQVAKAFPCDCTYVYTVDGHWLSPNEAARRPWDVAASNWHALASWIAGRGVLPCDNLRMLVDVGSTTTDIIPLMHGQVATDARTDRDRLQSSQLVYSGYERTPISAVMRTMVVDDQECPVMAERFADSLDAYLTLGLTDEASENVNTADGRGRTRAAARTRLARMVGEDCETLNTAVIESLAKQVVEAQASRIEQAIIRNLGTVSDRADSRPYTILFSGHGTALIQRVSQRLSPLAHCCVAYLDDYVSTAFSRCAPAWAVAALLSKRC